MISLIAPTNDCCDDSLLLSPLLFEASPVVFSSEDDDEPNVLPSYSSFLPLNFL